MRVPTIWTDRSTARASAWATVIATLRAAWEALAEGAPDFSREQPRLAGTLEHRIRRRIRDECFMRADLQALAAKN
jgi:hypothetical protein